jgi:hypothetical protein
MSSKIRIDKCLWLRSQHGENQPVLQSLMRSVKKRGIKVQIIDVFSPTEMRQLRDHLWKSDQHVILQGLLPKELNALKPIFAIRKNFSVMPIDWWVSPFWFAKHATFNIFHTYNGIMVHTRKASFITHDFPPWFYVPQRNVIYEYQSALLRPAALLTAPFIDLYKTWQRSTYSKDSKRFLYFPYPIVEEDVPLNSEPPQFDFTNLGAIMGTWLMRDAFVPSSLSFANLYADRQRLIKLIAQFQDKYFKIYDRRQHKAFVTWDQLTRIIRQSRFVICTGGLHFNCVPKYLEYTCLGVPMIGTALPFEHPWLERCMVQVNPMKISPTELKNVLVEALEKYPVLRQNCLAIRDTLMRRYHPDQLLDLLQAQIDGNPIPPGYLK